MPQPLVDQSVPLILLFASFCANVYDVSGVPMDHVGPVARPALRKVTILFCAATSFFVLKFLPHVVNLLHTILPCGQCKAPPTRRKGSE